MTTNHTIWPLQWRTGRQVSVKKPRLDMAEALLSGLFVVIGPGTIKIWCLGKTPIAKLSSTVLRLSGGRLRPALTSLSTLWLADLMSCRSWPDFWNPRIPRVPERGRLSSTATDNNNSRGDDACHVAKRPWSHPDMQLTSNR